MTDEFGFEMGTPEYTTTKNERIAEALKANPTASYVDIAISVFASSAQVSAMGRKMGLGARRGRGINLPGTKFKDLADYGSKAPRLKARGEGAV